jgi:hypothetical protein
MQESEVKHVTSKSKKAKLPHDPSMKAGARGGDEDAKTKAPENEEPPIIQRYSE